MIVKDGKMSNDEMIKKLSSAIEDGKEDVYTDLYESVYGKTITRQLAEEKIAKMESSDGVETRSGQKWNLEQTTDVGNKLNIDWQEVSKNEWYFVMNMMYHDYWGTAKYAEKPNDAMFYGHLAKDWCYDEDASEDKSYNYIMKVLC